MAELRRPLREPSCPKAPDAPAEAPAQAARPRAQEIEAKEVGQWARFCNYVMSMKNNGILIQAVGVLFRHVLALYGVSLCLRGLFNWRTVVLAVSLWPISGLGVTAGAHRLWSHGSYTASIPMQILLLLMFSIADQGTITGWALTHAMHHEASDTEWDPHNRPAGFWHAHIGWLYSVKRFRLSPQEYHRVMGNLGNLVQAHDITCILWDPFMSLVMPAIVASFWADAWAGFFVAGAVRWAFVQHVTFFVNSVAHGEKEEGSPHAFDTTGQTDMGPRVSLLTTVLALGEGWHEYHHLFPWDYAAAELNAWDQWNPTKVFIDICCNLGLASGRRRCSDRLQQLRRMQLSDDPTEECDYKVEGPLFLKHREKVGGA